jgi:hypothetical protein
MSNTNPIRIIDPPVTGSWAEQPGPQPWPSPNLDPFAPFVPFPHADGASWAEYTSHLKPERP